MGKVRWLVCGCVRRDSIAGQLTSNLHLGRTFAFTADREKRVLALTTTDIKEAFKKFIDPDKLTVLRAGEEIRQTDNNTVARAP